ncbi:MAG: HAD hydrolase family protein [Chloroflexota bacterium]|nr:HAD hydrolase family protein [Chloroflexota bacterium]
MVKISSNNCLDNYKFLVLDLNGTLTLDGILLEGVAERLPLLKKQYQTYLLTADMHGTGKEISNAFDMTFICIEKDNETFDKGDFVMKLGPEKVIAIGAGNNDSLMLSYSGLGIAVIGPEGLAISTMNEADIIAPNILIALDLLMCPNRLLATLRG